MGNTKKPSSVEGIAIVGMAGRFPGAATIAEFWQNLVEGREAITFASRQELLDAGVDPVLAADANYVAASSTIREPEYFDAAFFGYSAREAEIIDPQQRVFLECAWDALEDAACDPSSYAGAIGVFAGAGMNTYGMTCLLANPEVLAAVGAYQAMLGNDKDFLASRVAYKLNLRGPAVVVQTACSTSLVAVQMAFESLRRGECDMALAGGVSIALPQQPGYLYMPGMILSRDGRCRAFDAAASGIVPGAGAGVVVLKRLSDALADGDHLYGVIRGAAINNDGSAKVGYTAPSVEGQQAAVRRSMEMAGFDPATVTYVEAHGTGTEVGDPIEVAALSRAFANASGTQWCALGALKTNIGHLDIAAGVAGLIKATLALRHRLIPPTLHFTASNPLIDFARSPFYVNTAPVEYRESAPFRAGVSSFGIGGTNAHVSLEEAPAAASDTSAHGQLIVLSAKSVSALDRRMADLAAYLDREPETSLADLAFTLQVGRQPFGHRQAIVARSVTHLREQLANPHSAELRKLRAEPTSGEPAVVFLFPGQGAQYVTMGRGLYDTVPAFRDAVDRCASILEPHLGLDLRTVLYPESDHAEEAERQLARTAITQPALFTIEYAMASLWQQCGIAPAAMVGHSVGEYVAACLAGVFSLEDALALIAERGRLIQSMPVGVMLAVSLAEQDLAPLLTPGLAIAAVNGEQQTVVSGAEEEIAAFQQILERKQFACRRLRTSHAFHSAMMEPAIAPFMERVRRVALHPPRIRYLSNVTGTWITAAQATDPAYWGAHLRQGVRFADCMRTLLREPDLILLETGPGETLASLVRPQAARTGATVLTSMRHPLAQAADRDQWLSALGRLWLKNVRVAWKGMYADERRLRLSLPTYPFERRRYWLEPGKPASASASPASELPRESELADWFYLPSWKKSLAGSLDPPQHPLCWLVFAERDALSQELPPRLRALGRVIEVRSGESFRILEPDRYEIRPESREDYVALLRDLAGRQIRFDRIVCLRQTVEHDCGVPASLALLQALDQELPDASLELNILAEGAYSLAEEPIASPSRAARFMFWRVAAVEFLRLRIRTLDIGVSASIADWDAILAELQTTPAWETVAYRGRTRWMRMYEPVRIGSPAPGAGVQLRTGGTYVITGGLGGLGLLFGRHLATRTQGRILLLARTPLPPEPEWPLLLVSPDTPATMKERIHGVQAIAEAGGQPVVIQADVTDTAAMEEVLQEIRHQYGSIHGIIHAAGIAGPGLIQLQSPEEARAVLEPKVQGSEWLLRYLPNADLDFVLLCSSINALRPAPGLSAYAAANAWLDAFAMQHDDSAGTRVISVNWDTWQQVGMAANAVAAPALARQREEEMQYAILPAEGGALLDRILSYPLAQILVCTRDMNALERKYARIRKAALESADGAHAQYPPQIDPAASADVDEEKSFVIGIWRELLGVESVGPDDNFFELGGHSLMGTQVLSRIRDRFRISLPLRSIFDAATPSDLAARIRLLRWAIAPATEEPASGEGEREEIEI